MLKTILVISLIAISVILTGLTPLTLSCGFHFVPACYSLWSFILPATALLMLSTAIWLLFKEALSGQLNRFGAENLAFREENALSYYHDFSSQTFN